MGKSRIIAIAAAVVGAATLIMATATDAKAPPQRTAVVASATIPVQESPVMVPVTVHLGEGVWHVTGEGNAADCRPPTTTGTLVGDVIAVADALKFPALVVEIGPAGGTVTLECHNAEFGSIVETATVRLVAVPVSLQ